MQFNDPLAENGVNPWSSPWSTEDNQQSTGQGFSSSRDNTLTTENQQGCAYQMQTVQFDLSNNSNVFDHSQQIELRSISSPTKNDLQNIMPIMYTDIPDYGQLMQMNWEPTTNSTLLPNEYQVGGGGGSCSGSGASLNIAGSSFSGFPNRKYLIGRRQLLF
jgi:hypothetical protein